MNPSHQQGFTAWLRRTQRWHALWLLAVSALVLLPRLGEHGLRSTEGHRAIPGWEALDTGRWLPTTMFGAVYVRKPPGMPWAIAASSALLGETELAARLPSAISAAAMTIIAFAFATRWFGPPWGLAAGLAQALMPRLWPASRTADIEALLCLGVQIAAFALVHALVHLRAPRRRAAWPWAFVGALGLITALLAKAHAGLPVVAGVLIGACIVRRSARPLASPAAWGAILMAAITVAPVAWIQVRAMRGEDAVTEDFSKFLWTGGRLVEWIVFPFAAWASGLPASLALLFPWGPDAKRECEGSPEERVRLFAIARCLAVAFVVAVGIYMIAGVTNERYAMPALILMPPIVAYVARGGAEFFTARRARIARWMSMGSPIVWPVLLLVGAAVFIALLEPRDARSSARPAGIEIARSIRGGGAVWADAWVNAKPELLWYAARECAREGRTLTPLWKPRELRLATYPPDGTRLLLKDAEVERYRASRADGWWIVQATGEADGTRYTFMKGRGR